MNIRSQAGAVTLMVTSVLLICALVLSLGSYKSVLYQIKRAQNELKARQDYWKAEGGVECLYAYISKEPSKISSLTSPSNTELNAVCKNKLGLTSLYNKPLGSDKFDIYSETKHQKVNKMYSYGSITGLGAIQTTADLRIHGAADIAPDASNEEVSPGLYKCVAVRYKGKVTFEKDGGNLVTTRPMKNGPFDGFDGDCASTHKTILTQSASTDTNPALFKKDYKQDSSLDPFLNYFKMKKTAANIALAKADYTVVNLDTIADGETCGQKITDNLTMANPKLWIVGHCIIKSPIAVAFPSSLVVENGIFAVNGATVFSGSFYHMVDKDLPSFSASSIASYWSQVTFNGTISSWLGPKTVYFDLGAFHPKGGMNFDSEGLEVVLRGSYNLDYSASNNPNPSPKKLEWKEGGWYAY